MNIIHQLSGSAIKKDVEHPVAFILVNDRKDFATFYGAEQSRYEGFFTAHADTFIKTLSRVVRSDEVDGIGVYDTGLLASFRYGSGTELYSIIQDEPVLIYENSADDNLIVRLDMRDQFHIPQWGRDYSFFEVEDAIVVRYRDDYVVDPVFLAVLHDGTFNPLGTWISVEYERDKRRYSEPTTLYEYNLGDFAASKLIFAFGTSEMEALERARRYAGTSQLEAVSKNRVKVKQAGDRPNTTEKKIAKTCAQSALDRLFIHNRMLAGMPWFTKAWVRDELISLPALPELKARDLISKYLDADWSGGKFPVIFGGKNHCSDGLGLLAWAILFGGYSLSEAEKRNLAKKLARAVEDLEKMENEHGFIPSGVRESWMDSIERIGYPVETQALYSKIIHLAQLLTGSDYYDKKRLGLLKSIRKHYFVGGFLHDRLNDDTKRPNLFLAALFAPEILSKAEWETCFDTVLQSLWLDWGGLSSVDVQNECFIDVSAGECDTSYHNGDSWFFVNNIAALVLRYTNAAKYEKYVNAILDASTREILWHNYVGQPGEISSARALESWGCGLQGFSSAAYVYLVNNMKPKRRIVKDVFVLQPSEEQREAVRVAG